MNLMKYKTNQQHNRKRVSTLTPIKSLEMYIYEIKLEYNSNWYEYFTVLTGLPPGIINRNILVGIPSVVTAIMDGTRGLGLI